MKALVIIRKLCKELEDMVRAETDDGWDWAVELDKQVHEQVVPAGASPGSILQLPERKQSIQILLERRKLLPTAK